MSYIVKLWGFIIVSLTGIIIYLRHAVLSARNKRLQEEIISAQKVADIQTKVLNATTHTPNTNLSGVLERLRKNKL